jgi:hypothetical protein
MKSQLVIGLPVVIGLSLVFFPSFWVHLMMVVDFFTAWELFNSDIYGKYHQFIVSRLPDRPEMPIQEISYMDATKENIYKVTKGFTWPVVIRGLLGNSTGVQKWGDAEWWNTNYPDEPVLCSEKGPYLSITVDNCTISKWFKQLKTSNPYYITGMTDIFDRHPILHDHVNNAGINEIEPGKRISTQAFLGLPGHGSDIHCAAGVNIFRMVTGTKKWWFIPPSQTAYIKPSINLNGFSAFTHTLVGKEGKEVSPWMTKLERYTVVVQPGDVLINPPWFWHGILNMGPAGQPVIGCPSRYARGHLMKSAFRSNWFLQIIGLACLVKKYGWGVLGVGASFDMQKAIMDNRKVRNVEMTTLMEGEHPMDVESALAADDN